MTDASLIEIFCILDEFCKYLAPELPKNINYLRMVSATEIEKVASLIVRL